MPTVMQESFNAGELSPKMDARLGQARYDAGMRIALNGWLYPHGSFDRRPGLRFIHPTKTDATRQKALPFIFNVDQAYVLEFGIGDDGAGYMRVNKDKGQVWIPDTDAAINDTEWDDLSGAGCSVSVVDDVISLTCDGGGEAAIAEQDVAFSHGGELHSMTFQVVNGPVMLCVGTTSGGVEIIEDAVKEVGYHTVSFTPAAGVDTLYIQFFYDLGAETKEVKAVKFLDDNAVEIRTPFTTEDQLRELKITQSADVVTFTHGSIPAHDLKRYSHTEWAMVEKEVGPSIDPPTGLTASVVGTAGTTEYSYVVTALTENDEESLRSVAVTVTTANETLSEENYVELNWSEVPDATIYHIYRLKNGLDSYLGKSGDNLFHDIGEKNPNEDENPPIERNPFEDPEDYPVTATYHKQRLVLCHGLKVEMSRVAIPNNFNRSVPLADDDAVSFKLMADEQNDIVWALSGKKKLFLGTTGGEWVVAGENGEAITPSNPDPDKETNRGAHWTPPLRIGNVVLFVERPGKIVREFKYTLEDDAYSDTDISILSEHMTKKSVIVDWCYQSNPLSTAWVILENGECIALAYNQKHEIVGWTRMETDGLFESCCCIPGDGDDEVWFTLRRYVNGQWRRYMECLDHEFVRDELEYAFFVDSGLSKDNPITITDVTNANPAVVTVDPPDGGHGLEDGDTVRITGVKKRLVVRADGDKAGYEAIVPLTEINGKNYTIDNVTATTFELVDTDSSGWPAYFCDGEVRKCITTITGLDHLEGKEVQILADGSVHPEQIVTGGAITLNDPKSHIHVGLPYKSVMMPMKAEAPTQEGTIQGKTKRILNVWVRVMRTLGIKFGPSLDDLRQVLAGNALVDNGTALSMLTEDLELEPDGGYDPDVLFMVVQDQPLPMSVVAIIMDLEVE